MGNSDNIEFGEGRALPTESLAYIISIGMVGITKDGIVVRPDNPNAKPMLKVVYWSGLLSSLPPLRTEAVYTDGERWWVRRTHTRQLTTQSTKAVNVPTKKMIDNAMVRLELQWQV